MGSFYAVLVKPVMARHGGLKIIALTMMIGGIGLWLLVGSAWGIWVNPAIVEKPALAAWSLIILALMNTTVTQLMRRAVGGPGHHAGLVSVFPQADHRGIVFLASWPTGLQRSCW